MRIGRTLAGLLLATLALAARGEDASVQTTLSLSFHRCIRPERVTCIAFREEDKPACRACEEWTSVNVYRPIDTTMSEQPYLGRRRYANQFVKAVLTDIYGLAESQTARYVPSRIKLLYDNPARYGWVELPMACDGALIVDRRKAALINGGLVTGGPSDRGPLTPRLALRNALRLFHPSSKGGGRLRYSLARHFFNNPSEDGQPKVMLPDFVMYGRPVSQTGGLDTGDIPFGWSSWFEQPPGPTYVPVTTLRPNENYNFLVHLAPFAYRHLYGVSARAEVMERLKLLTHTTEKAVRLKALVITDEAYLRPTGSNVAPVEIDLDAVRRWQADPYAPAGDPLAELRRGKGAPFVFGAAVVQVRTGAREGPTSLGVSIWDEDGWPIDEFVAPICIATDARAQTICRKPWGVNQSFGGADLARTARDKESRPDAAIHLIDTGTAGITGIFRRNDQPDAPYHVWRVKKTRGEFLEILDEMMRSFAEAQDEPNELARAGERLYATVFGGNNPSNETALAARKAFEDFARPHMQRVRSGGEAPSLYVRFVEGGSVRHTRLLPIGAAKLPGRPNDFLGFYFRVETPLARQITDSSKECITRWSLLVPPASDTRLGPLRRRLNERLPDLLQQSRVYESIKTFRQWLKRDETEAAGALMILSHHSARNGIGRFQFTGTDYVASDEVQRRFQEPSVAILLSCGSGGVGTEDFVNVLNERGIDAVLATRHDVSTPLAVDFLDCLAASLPQATSAATTTLAAAHFDAVQCVRTKTSPATGKPYGASALAHLLVGNSSLRLCRPKS